MRNSCRTALVPTSFWRSSTCQLLILEQESVGRVWIFMMHFFWSVRPLVCEDIQADVEDGQLQFFYILAFVRRGDFSPLLPPQTFNDLQTKRSGSARYLLCYHSEKSAFISGFFFFLLFLFLRPICKMLVCYGNSEISGRASSASTCKVCLWVNPVELTADEYTVLASRLTLNHPRHTYMDFGLLMIYLNYSFSTLQQLYDIKLWHLLQISSNGGKI